MQKHVMFVILHVYNASTCTVAFLYPYMSRWARVAARKDLSIITKLSTTMSKRPRRRDLACDACAPLPKRPRIDAKLARELTAHSNQTKTSLVHTLQKLNKMGELEYGVTRRELKEATEFHAKQKNAYGRVVEKIRLGAPKLEYLDIANPFAFLVHLCSISTHFADMMHKCCLPGRPLRLVIYADEMNPGNPFRPEKSRTLQCIYWAFVDWPAHVLSRTFAWMALCTIRSSIVDTIPGGMSYICRMILRLFYPADTYAPSMARGIMLECRGEPFIMTAVFAGFLADLKGHKENLEWKGTSGNVCCVTCANLDKRIRGDTGNATIGLDCSDPQQFIRRSNEDVYAAVDQLVERSRGKSKAAREAMETEYGFNIVPDGLLLDKSLRVLFKPVDHTLRDWQHTIVGDGVANSVLGETLQKLKAFGYTWEGVRAFMMECNLPSKYGKPHRDWLRDSRIKAHNLTSFSGIILTVVPILFLYMQAHCRNDERLIEHMKLVKLLHRFCGILATGSEKPMEHIDRLRRIIQRLHAKYVQLFTKLKPKLHHMHHILDAMEWLGKCLSCFVTERKHRAVKDIALHVFRHMEHVVITDIVNQHCEQVQTGHDLFEEEFLVEPRELAWDNSVLVSNKAVLKCGVVHKGDIVFFGSGVCALVKRFWAISEAQFVEVVELPMVKGDISLRYFSASAENQHTLSMFEESRFVIDSCIWHSTDIEGIIRVCVPVVLDL